MLNQSPEFEKARDFLEKVRGCSDQEIYRSRLELFRNLCEEHSKEFADQVEMHLTFYQMGVDTVNPRKRILLLVYHGIRTNAEWTTTLKSVLRVRNEEIVVETIGYGYVNVFMFLSPFFTRWIPIRFARIKTNTALLQNDGKEIVVLAHSFGTYILTKILKNAEFRPERIILCGSVVSPKFNWAKLSGSPITPGIKKIINDCGDRDWWPVLATFATVGFGPSGTIGFKSAGIEDRHHVLGHSDYLKRNEKNSSEKTGEEFMKEFWVPFIVDGKIVESNYGDERKTAPYGMYVLQFLRIRNWIILFAVLWLWKSWPMIYSKIISLTHF